MRSWLLSFSLAFGISIVILFSSSLLYFFKNMKTWMHIHKIKKLLITFFHKIDLVFRAIFMMSMCLLFVVSSWIDDFPLGCIWVRIKLFNILLAISWVDYLMAIVNQYLNCLLLIYLWLIRDLFILKGVLLTIFIDLSDATGMFMCDFGRVKWNHLLLILWIASFTWMISLVLVRDSNIKLKLIYINSIYEFSYVGWVMLMDISRKIL